MCVTNPSNIVKCVGYGLKELRQKQTFTTMTCFRFLLSSGSSINMEGQSGMEVIGKKSISLIERLFIDLNFIVGRGVSAPT